MRYWFLLLLLLMACGPRGYIEPNYFTGTEGLVVTVNDNVGDQIYEGMDAILSLRVANKGATRVNYSFVTYNLSGDPFYVSVSQSDFRFSQGIGFLYGKEIGYPYGDWVDLVHTISVKPIQGLRAKPDTQLFGSICYPYETLFSTNTCVDSNTFNGNVQNQVCTSATTTHESQGAPIAITKIENIPTPMTATGGDGSSLRVVKPVFIIHVANVGDGTVVMPITPQQSGVFSGTRVDAFPSFATEHAGSILSSYFYDQFTGDGTAAQSNPELVESIHNTCSQRQTSYNNAVGVFALLSNTSLDCNPRVIQLYEDQGFTTCTLPDENLQLYGPNYVGALQVRLAYVYKSTFTHNFEIIRRETGYDGDITIKDLEGPGFINGQVGCDYCSTHPNDPSCRDWGGKFPLSCEYNPLMRSCGGAADTAVTEERKDVTLTRSFSCSCGPKTCIEGRDNKNVDCVFGNHLCPGTGICCAESFDALYAKEKQRESS